MTDGAVKYVAVREHLEGRIAGMAAGDQLPTEPVLCQEYGVSRITIRRAVEDLIHRGRLVREQGRGTFVTDPRYTEQVREEFADRVTGFYRQQTVLGRRVTTKVLANHRVRNQAASTALGLNAADELIELERLRYVDGTLHQHVFTFLAASRYPGVLEQDLTEGSLFEYLEREYGTVLLRNDLLVRLDHVSDRVAKALQLDPGEAVLAIESTVFSERDVPVAFGIARHTPAHSELSFSLRNGPASAGA